MMTFYDMIRMIETRLKLPDSNNSDIEGLHSDCDDDRINSIVSVSTSYQKAYENHSSNAKKLEKSHKYNWVDGKKKQYCT